MDKGRIVKELKNDNIVTELINSDNLEGGLFSPKMVREERYEKLKVVQGDEEVPEGEEIIVPYGKGTLVTIKGKDYIFVNKKIIISIL